MVFFRLSFSHVLQNAELCYSEAISDRLSTLIVSLVNIRDVARKFAKGFCYSNTCENL